MQVSAMIGSKAKTSKSPLMYVKLVMSLVFVSSSRISTKLFLVVVAMKVGELKMKPTERRGLRGSSTSVERQWGKKCYLTKKTSSK